MGSESEDVEPSGVLWLDDHCNLWVGDEVKQVGGDDEGGEGVLRLVPVPHILLLLSFEGEEQARHTSGYQTTPVWVLWQLTNGLLSGPIFAPKKGREDGGNVNVNVNSRTNLDIGLNARTGNFPLNAEEEETTLWSEEFGPKKVIFLLFLNLKC